MSVSPLDFFKMNWQVTTYWKSSKNARWLIDPVSPHPSFTYCTGQSVRRCLSTDQLQTRERWVPAPAKADGWWAQHSHLLQWICPPSCLRPNSSFFDLRFMSTQRSALSFCVIIVACKQISCPRMLCSTRSGSCNTSEKQQKATKQFIWCTGSSIIRVSVYIVHLTQSESLETLDID
jgi:hypothetical protein